jgi:DNA-binding SARP family transcriptional activator
MTATLQINAFGRLNLSYNGNKVVSFPTRVTEELLSYLLLNPYIEHSREKLGFLLWPQSDVDQSRPQLSTTLWRLRKTFSRAGVKDKDYIVSGRDWVAFSPKNPPQLDFKRFEDGVTYAQEISNLAEREEALKAAIDLYQGDLFEGNYANWCLVERERLSRQYLRALGQLMGCQMERDDFEAAIDTGNQIVRRDFLREEVHRALMYCYWVTNQRDRAVKQFHQCTHNLKKELQIMPMPETIVLYQQIVVDRWKGTTERIENVNILNQFWQAFNQFEEAGKRLNDLMNTLELDKNEFVDVGSA